MDCKQIRPLIHGYLDEDIDSEKNQILQAHLQTCAECREIMHEIQKAIAFVQSASHIHAPSDFTAKVMAKLPAPTKANRFAGWLRAHPFLSAAAVFLLLMGGSLVSSWVDQDDYLQVASSEMDKLKIDQKRHVVIVPEGTTVSGDIIVRNGNVEVEGQVNGDVVAIDGEVRLMASTAHIAGNQESIKQIVDYIWYELKNIGNDLLPMTP
ncbi:zf-HC2 domain-containing protein [Brevibacillus dissolubilis]|uniref:zf-HC2 domain-containing protein n=1 Tax=Brevibacillus dissolubilis TaxID=1844116 RepID=UPI001116B80D|nr:zf-HC2 domain-containing protein [Brevibacillus dissolubilis]